MAIFNNETITGQRIVLDENEYRNCTLVNCEIVYRGGVVTFEFKVVGCHWRFEGCAFNTLKLATGLGMVVSAPKPAASWKPSES